MKLWEKFSDSELQQFVQNSISLNELAVKLGYSDQSGSGIAAVKEMLEIKHLDTTHFLGQGWNKNNYDYSRFQPNSKLRSADALAALVKLRGRKCEKCGLQEWQGQKIPLQVHHIDGNHYNNVIDNLQILCPNCHAQTDTYAGHNKNRVSISDEEFIEALKNESSIYAAIKKLGMSSGKYAYERANQLVIENNIVFNTNKKQYTCKKCGSLITAEATYCSKCAHELTRKVERPSREELKQLIRTTSFLGIARLYNNKITDNGIRKWCESYNLPKTKKEINSYSDEEWELI